MRLLRLLAHAILGAIGCALLIGISMRAIPSAAVLLHVAIALPFFSLVSWSYFRKPNPFPAIVVGLTFAGTASVADLIGARIEHHAHALSLTSGWVGYVMIFVATCVTSALLSAQPWKKHA